MGNAQSDKVWEEYGGVCPIIPLLEQVHSLPDAVKKQINENTSLILIKKNKYIISPLQKTEHMYFIIEGIVRGFFKEGDQEITTWINVEGDIIGSIRNLWQRVYPDDYVQALEDMKLVSIPFTLTAHLYATSNEMNIIGRKITEQYYQATEERAFIGKLLSAERRYLRFMQSTPELIDRLPLKYIASYLKMRVETLVRIRSKISKKNNV